MVETVLIALRLRIMLSVVVLLTGSVGAATANVDTGARPASFAVDVDDGLLTLRARNALLSEIIKAIGGHAGFETIVLGAYDARVDLSFSNVPLEVGLDRLLSGSSRVIVYSPSEKDSRERRVVRLWLLGSGPADRRSVGEIADAVANDLQGADAKGRSEAVLRLGSRHATDTELEALAQALQNDEVALVRTRAAIALGALADERAVPVLEAALLDPNSSVRIQAIHALSKIGGDRAISALGDVLLHSNDTVQRVVAAQSLALQNGPVAQQYLDAVANDPDKQIRAASKNPSNRSRPSRSERRSDVNRLGTEIPE